MVYESLGSICGIQNCGVNRQLFEEYAKRRNVVVAVRRKRCGARSVSFNGHRAVSMADAVKRIEAALASSV